MDILQKIDLVLRNFDIDDFVHHPTQMIIEAEHQLNLLETHDVTNEMVINDAIHNFVKVKTEQHRLHFANFDFDHCCICGHRRYEEDNDFNVDLMMCRVCAGSLRMDWFCTDEFDDFIAEQEAIPREEDEEGCYEPHVILHELFTFK